MARSLPALLALTLLAACSGAVRQPQTSVPAVPEREIADAALYAVSTADSEVQILVFRGGPLARLGHNHVMTSRSLAGRVWLHRDLARSGFELSFPVQELIVDEPEARSAAGSEFATQLSQADRDGTRRNMLGPQVLDAQRYPAVRLESVGLSGSAAEAVAHTRITIRDASRVVQVPVAISLDGPRLAASGELEILQSDFGMQPFSVALGALTVQDRLAIRFKVVADAVAP